MRKSITFLLVSVLVAFISSAGNIYSKTNSDDLNVSFYISSNNYYYPGDAVSVYLYSYDYFSGKKNKNKKINFSFQIYKIKDIAGFYSNQTSRNNLDVLGRDSTNLTYLADEVGSFTKNLKPYNEYGYYYISENIPVNISEKGAYLVKVSAGNHVGYCGFIVTSTGVISKAGRNSLLAFVVDRKSGTPVLNSELNFYIGSRQIGKGNSSNDGMFYQEVKDEVLKNDDNNIPLIIGKSGDDIIISDPYLYFGYSGDRFSTYVFTNQPVYRTDSDVLFKGTIKGKTSAGYESYANREITVLIKDSRNAEVYKKVLKTNDVGSFDGTYRIDKDAPLGNYTIIVQINEKNSSSIIFSVEQYKKPEYKVTVITNRSQYYGNDNLTATVEAKYFFGSPVADADVEYNVYKIRYYKPWWAFSEWSWWYEDYYASLEDNSKFKGAEYIYTGKAKLNSEGKFEFNYKIKEDFKSNRNDYDRWYYYWYSYESDYKYIVQAKVVDKSRREISGLTSVFVTRGGFYLNAKSDKYLYKPAETANIEILANDFSDKPAKTDFTVEIYKTNWGRFEYKENRDLVKTLKGTTKGDGKGIVSYEISDYSAEGSYSAEVKAFDEKGNEIKASTYFYVWGSDYWWSYNRSEGIQIITDKDSYKKGDICKALIFTTIPNVSVLITTETDNIITCRVEKFSGTTKAIEFNINENYVSNFRISANYVNNGQFYTSNKSLMLIPEEKFLTVQIEPSKQVYKPGEEGLLKVRVLDNEGKSVNNAEVSLGIIDESIYYIKDESVKDIRKAFYGNNLSNVSTTFNTYASNYGYSRLMTIYEKFNIHSTKESELATVKGTLLTKSSVPVSNATIVIDKDYKAAVTNSDGSFEFKLPDGSYSIGIIFNNFDYDDLMNISLSKGETKTIKLYTDKEMNEITEYEQNFMSSDNRSVTTGELRKETKVFAPAKLEEKSGQHLKKDKGDDEGKTVDLKEAEVRSDFKDAIFWSPYTKTDADGYAVVKIKYPDNLTSWRVTSRVITSDTKVGQMTHTIITRKDLLVRMETPRFLQDKDEVIISTIIHNYLSSEKNVRVKFKATNVTLVGENEKYINVASNSEQRIDWNIKVDNPYGEAKLYSEALTNEESDAVEMKVPLQPKGLEIIQPVIADYSENNISEKKYVDIPTGTDIRSAGLKFTVSPSLASTILSSLDELAGYPYGCVEQTMSRFLPTIVVANAFKELNAPINEATQKDLPKMVDAGIKRLYGFQHSDGGWGWWTNDATNPFMTAYVIYGLSIANSTGYNIRNDVIAKGVESMKNSLKSTLDPTTKAYVLYSMAIANSKDIEKYKDELDKLLQENINDYARSLIAMTYDIMGDKDMALKVVNELESRAKSTGEGASYWEGTSFHYNWQEDKVQTTAMGLKALVNIKGSSDLKNKIIRWLMMQRSGLAWRNTQETAMIIYAMVDYLKNSQELTPDYNVRIFVNGEKFYEKHMTKNDIFLKDSLIKIAGMKLKEGNNEIRIDKEGTGKVYFSANVSYYWDSERITPREDGFRVEKEYYKLEKYESYNGQNITYRKKHFDGDAKSGDMILVKIRVYSKENNMNFFMLEDPIPAGCEITKDDWAFRVEDEKDYSGYTYYWWRWWYADKDVRDNKVNFFATYLYGDAYEFSYIMRAQIPGDYNINPAKGMLMYYTDVSGSSGNMKMHIED